MNGIVYLRAGFVERAPLMLTVPLCEDPVISTYCICGGLLAFVGNRWQHAEACIACFASTEPCPDSRSHRACLDPQPVTCWHGSCLETVELEIECASGLPPGECCGCCWVPADMLEGKRTWPMHLIRG